MVVFNRLAPLSLPLCHEHGAAPCPLWGMPGPPSPRISALCNFRRVDRHHFRIAKTTNTMEMANTAYSKYLMMLASIVP